MKLLNIKEVINIAKSKLSHIENPIKEAELILAFYLQKTRIFLHTNPTKIIKNIDKYFNLIEQRANHKPLEYITSSACFYGYDFYVNKDVLIPRAETEILIDKIKSKIDKNTKAHIIDIGCGSGIIPIVLAKYFNNAKITAVDISKKSLKVAKQNAISLNVENKITFIESNLLDKVKDNIDIIISNPPYIKNNEKLKSNVKDYEPHLALFGGTLGYEILKRIIEEFFLRKCKYLFCEMACYQKQDIQNITNKYLDKTIEFYKDLSGLDRGFIIHNTAIC
jgi:release factor glutamine methyltransferase